MGYKKLKRLMGVVNLIKANEFIDVPVLDFGTKNIICTICDILLNDESAIIVSFLCDKKGLKKSNYTLYLKDIISKSNDGIIVKNQDAIKHLSSTKITNIGLSYKERILNKTVLNSKGELIGILRDMIFDLTAGYILGFELSEGYFDDIFTGRKLIKAGSGYFFSENNIIIPYEGIVKEQGRGLINLSKLDV